MLLPGNYKVQISRCSDSDDMLMNDTIIDEEAEGFDKPNIRLLFNLFMKNRGYETEDCVPRKPPK